jgi:transcriptional regulator with XRE-family HTH domain
MPLERRIRAAQVLGGFKSLDDLAAAIGRENNGLSRKTLRRIASDNDPRQAKDYELEWIAAACGVPLSFFSGDIATDPSPAQLDRIEQALAVVTHREERAQQDRDAILKLLAKQDQILEDIGGLLAQQTLILTEMQRVAAGLPSDEALRLLNEGARQLSDASRVAQAERAAQSAAHAETHRRRVGD